MSILLDSIYLLAIILYSPVVIYRMLRHNRYRQGWAERFGDIDLQPGKKRIWIHAVSVGEVNSCKTIVKKLQEELSDYEIVISTTTDTGFGRAKSLFGLEHKVFYFPLDFSFVMRRAFKRVDPVVCILMELEVWPNFVKTAAEGKIDVVVANARLSEKSFGRYKLIRPFSKKVFEKVSLVLAQTEVYAKRFEQIGISTERISVTGSLKYDTAEINKKVAGSDEIAQRLKIVADKLWVAGGTGNQEETKILDAYRRLIKDEKFRDVRLVLVPRKPERFGQVAQIIKQWGFAIIRYSEVKKSGSAPVTDKQTVILVDTIGDLRKFYSLATIIFVGRSLVPMGGSDMMEAAALGKCTMFGPYAFNFFQTVDQLVKGEGSILVKDTDDLLLQVRRCLSDPEYAEKIASNGQKIIEQNQGATERTISQILSLLKSE